MIVSLAVFTSRWWMEPSAQADQVQNPTLRFGATTLLIYLQLIVGSWMRHSDAALAIPDFPLAFGKIIPPLSNPLVAIHFAHRIGALMILLFVSWNFIYVLKSFRTQPKIMRPSILLMLLVLIQITLGALTVWTKTAVPIATSHVIVGAITLATSLVLTLRSYRIFHGLSRAASPAWKPAVETA